MFGQGGERLSKSPKTDKWAQLQQGFINKTTIFHVLRAHVMYMYIKRFFRSGFSDVLYLNIIILLKEKGDFLFNVI